MSEYIVCIEKHPTEDWHRAVAYQVTEIGKSQVVCWTWSSTSVYSFVERCAKQLRVRYSLEGKIVVHRLGLFTEVVGKADDGSWETIYRNEDPRIVLGWLVSHRYEQISVDKDAKRKYRVCGEYRKV